MHFADPGDKVRLIKNFSFLGLFGLPGSILFVPVLNHPQHRQRIHYVVTRVQNRWPEATERVSTSAPEL